MAKVLKGLAKEVRIVQNFKANSEEIKKIKENADKYAGGNVTAWIRYAAMNCIPKSQDLEEVV